MSFFFFTNIFWREFLSVIQVETFERIFAGGLISNIVEPALLFVVSVSAGLCGMTALSVFFDGYVHMIVWYANNEQWWTWCSGCYFYSRHLKSKQNFSLHSADDGTNSLFIHFLISVYLLFMVPRDDWRLWNSIYYVKIIVHLKNFDVLLLLLLDLVGSL